jgi:hypothetical protein
MGNGRLSRNVGTQLHKHAALIFQKIEELDYTAAGA